MWISLPKNPKSRTKRIKSGILRSKDVSKEVKDKVRGQYKTRNLVKLKKQIDEILKRLKPTKVR